MLVDKFRCSQVNEIDKKLKAYIIKNYGKHMNLNL
jgi:hypothetical protein